MEMIAAPFYVLDISSAWPLGIFFAWKQNKGTVVLAILLAPPYLAIYIYTVYVCPLMTNYTLWVLSILVYNVIQPLFLSVCMYSWNHFARSVQGIMWLTVHGCKHIWVQERERERDSCLYTICGTSKMYRNLHKRSNVWMVHTHIHIKNSCARLQYLKNGNWCPVIVQNSGPLWNVCNMENDIVNMVVSSVKL